jgi:hypothetical protein
MGCGRSLRESAAWKNMMGAITLRCDSLAFEVSEGPQPRTPRCHMVPGPAVLRRVAALPAPLVISPLRLVSLSGGTSIRECFPASLVLWHPPFIRCE